MKILNEIASFYKKFPMVTTLLMVNIFIFMLTTLSLFPNKAIFQQLAGVNIFISNGEWWRLITPIFVHGDFNHLFFNSLILIFSGTLLEERIKKSSFIFIYLGSGIFANIVTLFLAPPSYIHIGASGAIFGILGSLACLLYFKKLPRQQTQLLSIIILLSIVFTFFDSNVNMYAHIGGLIWGCLCGYLMVKGKIR